MTLLPLVFCVHSLRRCYLATLPSDAPGPLRMRRRALRPRVPLNNEQEPVLTVVYRTREVSDGQIGPDSTADALAELDWDRLYPLAGPVAMTDVEPGHILAVEVLNIHTEGWDWTCYPVSDCCRRISPMPAQDPRPHQRRSHILQGRHRHPYRAFLRGDGREPVWPREACCHAAGTVRRQHGHPHTTKGSILHLPVQHAGALSSPAVTPTLPRAMARSA